RESGGVVSGVPAKFTARSLADMLGARLEGTSFLILRPERTETDFAGLLRVRGAKVREVILYRTTTEQAGSEDLVRLLEKGDPGAILFASPSAVRGFLSMGGSGDAARSLPAICIGPVTAKAAVMAGFQRVLSPEVHTWDGMVEILLAQAGAIRKRRR
ncbi:MAG: uroporphyrinogen-III synthase, partial [Proteobacteria bacterium]|nr:uroporphyrinogen-III synthase [Pseudomonadota bacterium]